MNLLTNAAADRKKLNGIRTRLTENACAKREVSAAPLTREEIKAEILKEASERAENSPGPLGVFTQPVGSTYLLDPLGALASSPGAMADLLLTANKRAPVIIEIFVDQAIADGLDEEASQAMTAQRRQQKLAELDAQRRKLERQEELEILRLERAGWTVDRRTDFDVDLVFEIWEEEFKDAAA